METDRVKTKQGNGTIYIVLRQNLSGKYPECEVLSIDSSHLKGHHNMMKFIEDMTSQIALRVTVNTDVEVTFINKNRIEINNKSLGYLYNTEKLNYIYSIQKFESANSKLLTLDNKLSMGVNVLSKSELPNQLTSDDIS